MKTLQDIDNDISTLIWNHGLDLNRTDNAGYSALIDYIYEIEQKKQKLIDFIIDFKDVDYGSRSVDIAIDRIVEVTK